MTDLDVIEHVARLFGGRITALKFQKGNSRPLFQTGIYGEKARWVLNQVLPYMGERRSEKIAELLEHKPAYNRKLKTWPFYEEYCGEIFGVEPSW